MVRTGKLTQGHVGLGPAGRKMLATGVLLDGAFGHMPDGGTEAVFSSVLGGQRAGRRIGSDRGYGAADTIPGHHVAQGVLRSNRSVVSRR